MRISDWSSDVCSSDLTIDVGDVGRVHPHLAPIDPLLERLILAGEQARQRLALHVEMAGIDLELAEDRLGRQLTVVGQDDDMLAVVADRVGARGIDDDRTIMAELFLKPRMRSEEHTSELQSLMRI